MNNTLPPAVEPPVDPNFAIRTERAWNYSRQIWWFLSLFIAIIAILHLITLSAYWYRKRHYSRSIAAERVPRSSANPGKYNFQALANVVRIAFFRTTVPIGGDSVLNVAEISIICGYIAALLTWEFINSKNVITGTKLDVKYWSDRAANIVATQLPLVVALTMKNNIISFLTGVSFEKLNVLHRSAARTCLLLIWTHFWGRVYVGLLLAADIISIPWVRVAVMVATSYTVLVLISVRPIRRRYYEFFFFSHVTLVSIILAGAYYHLAKGPGYTHYILPSFILWGLDRSLRLFRVLYFNRNVIFTTSSSHAISATAELISPNMVRLTLERKMTWRPGQSAFLTVPSVSHMPFEAHPFTMACLSEDKDTNQLVFLIGARGGFTRRLRDFVRCNSHETGMASLSVYVDGPYGSPPDLNAFEHVVLISGGSGVSYALPSLQNIVRTPSGQSVCRSVFFIWVIPYVGNLSWAFQALSEALQTCPKDLEVKIFVYITKGENEATTEDEILTTKEYAGFRLDKLCSDKGIRITRERPNISELLLQNINGFSHVNSISVNVAGPPSLAKDVRGALSFRSLPSSVLKGPSITLHVETFGIA